jgi:hypothetical protein
MIMVKVGSRIYVHDDKKTYIVTSIWAKGASKVIDFTARQVDSLGININGEKVYASRGFSFKINNYSEVYNG